jgi:hypothetical protein
MTTLRNTSTTSQRRGLDLVGFPCTALPAAVPPPSMVIFLLWHAVLPSEFASTQTYAEVEVKEGWFPPLWRVARPPQGRELLIPSDFIDLTAPATWFVKQGAHNLEGQLKIALGPALDWPIVYFTSFKEGQSLEQARAIALEWVQKQPASERLGRVPVEAVFTRMFGRNSVLLDPICKLVQIRQHLYAMFGLLGYELDSSCMRTHVVEIMRPISQDLRDIRARIMWRHARELGVV